MRVPWQIETSGEQGKHADFSEPRCLCWCAADDGSPELIDGTTGYLAATGADDDDDDNDDDDDADVDAGTAAAAAVPRHAAAPQSSRFCSQAALRAFAALCAAARSAGMAPATLPAATDTAELLGAAGQLSQLHAQKDAAAVPHHGAAGAGAARPAAPVYESVKAGWREPEYSCARDLLLGRTIFRAWPACKQRGRG